MPEFTLTCWCCARGVIRRDDCACEEHPHGTHSPRAVPHFNVDADELAQWVHRDRFVAGLDSGIIMPSAPALVWQRADLGRAASERDRTLARARGTYLRTVRSLPLDPLPFRRADPPYRDTRLMLPRAR